VCVLTAFNAQAAALSKLHTEQQAQLAHQSIVSSFSSKPIEMLDDSVYESDDDDCPPLAHVSSTAVSGGLLQSGVRRSSTTAAAPGQAQTADTSSNRSSSEEELSIQQQQQQQAKQSQLCAQCGKLTKKRCRRCQAVYYCSEECQIQCFRDPQHRAQCEVAAASSALLA
jgi:MYND finger